MRILFSSSSLSFFFNRELEFQIVFFQIRLKADEPFIFVLHIHCLVFTIIEASETENTGGCVDGKGIQVDGTGWAFLNTGAACHTFLLDNGMIVHGSLGPPFGAEKSGKFS